MSGIEFNDDGKVITHLTHLFQKFGEFAETQGARQDPNGDVFIPEDMPTPVFEVCSGCMEAIQGLPDDAQVSFGKYLMRLSNYLCTLGSLLSRRNSAEYYSILLRHAETHEIKSEKFVSFVCKEDGNEDQIHKFLEEMGFYPANVTPNVETKSDAVH